VKAPWLAFVVIAALAFASIPSLVVHAKCGSRWSYPASPSERRGIKSAVRRRSRGKIVDVKYPPLSAPPGALEVVTLDWGTCDSGGGETFFVVKSGKGWRLLEGRGGWAIIH
jgi:hypothetical protein